MEIKQLRQNIERLFTDRMTFIMLLQEIAENFYPERADFTVKKRHGNEFASQLMTSYPILIRRDLGDQLGQMLRPTAQQWFKMIPEGWEEGDTMDNDSQRWLEAATKQMRRAMYFRDAKFTKAMKEEDQDYAAFGQGVTSCRTNRDVTNLLYRSWHIRDVVWQENEEGDIGLIARRWKPTYRDLESLFPGKVDTKVTDRAKTHPFEKLDCLHIIVEEDLYDQDSKGLPYFSIYYDVTHSALLEAVPVWNKEYNISRWQTVSGSQYAFSPATITALPDARMLQSMAYTLLEAGEKATNPPIVATQDVVRSDVAIYAGGITWVDEEYDEKLGEALRPLTQDFRGLPFGDQMAQDARGMLAQAFYLNKLTLPERAPEMTAYEVGQRIQEYVRAALPIFEPMEHERNGGTCDLTFDILMRVGVFGSPRDMPAGLQNRRIGFTFESPLHDVIEQQKGQKFLEAKEMLVQALDIDQSSLYLLDAKAGLRDALNGIGVPPTWINNQDDVEQMTRDQAEEVEQQALLENMKTSSEAAKNLSQAGQDLEVV